MSVSETSPADTAPADIAAAVVTARRGPVPSDDELAAILAAVEALWPRPVVAGAPIDESPRWRFSGRWWTKPVPSRRDRPF